MKDKIEQIELKISPLTVLMVVGILILLYLLWQIRTVIIMLFISFIIYSALKPLVDKAEDEYKIKRAVSIPLILVGFVLIINILVFMVVSNLAGELRNYDFNELSEDFVNRVESLPFVPDGTISNYIINENGDDIDAEDVPVRRLPDLGFVSTGTVFQFLSSTAGTLLASFTVLFVSYYMLQRHGNVYDGLLSFIPNRKQRNNIRKYANKIENKLGTWLLSQFALMLIVGVMTFIGLKFPALIFGEEVFSVGRFAFTMAIIAGILEIVPNIGPLFTLFIGVFLSVATGGEYILPQTIYIVILFALIQQLEAVLIVPKLMKQAVGIDPIVTILGIIAASNILGIAGAVLVIPLIVTLQILIEFLLSERELLAAEAETKN